MDDNFSKFIKSKLILYPLCIGRISGSGARRRVRPRPASNQQDDSFSNEQPTAGRRPGKINR